MLCCTAQCCVLQHEGYKHGPARGYVPASGGAVVCCAELCSGCVVLYVVLCCGVCTITARDKRTCAVPLSFRSEPCRSLYLVLFRIRGCSL
jgi:hypothetical protein